MRRSTKEKILFTAMGIPTVISVLVFALILRIISRGAGAIDWKFLTSSVLKGGVFEGIMGSLFLLSGATAMAAPIGVLAAAYLAEYARESTLIRVIDQAINNLAGVPSIVVGLFGYTFFSGLMGLGTSLLSGWLTLMLMMLPIVIRGSQEAIKMVPGYFEEAAVALGATKWRAIRDNVLPAAAPGIATSVILAIVRVAGETAAILFTSCVLVTRGLPTSPLKPVTALTYHLYVLITASPRATVDQIFGTALTLFSLVASLALVAMVLRIMYRRKWKW